MNGSCFFLTGSTGWTGFFWEEVNNSENEQITA